MTSPFLSASWSGSRMISSRVMLNRLIALDPQTAKVLWVFDAKISPVFWSGNI
jgi:hypothetical protein